MLGAGPGQWIGVYYYAGGLGIGCGPLDSIAQKLHAARTKLLIRNLIQRSSPGSHWLTATSPRSYTAIAIAIVIAGVLISASLYVAVEVPTRTTTTTTITDTFAQTTIVLSTVSSASCDYVIPAPCPSDENFTLSVNYTGPWTVKYQGYNEQCYTQRNSTSNCNSDYETLNKGEATMVLDPTPETSR